jgi:hypothetical protein
MNAVVECLKTVRLGVPQAHLNLTMFPLLHDGTGEPGYLLLDEAVQRGLARVTEVSAMGSVPELRLVNDADRRCAGGGWQGGAPVRVPTGSRHARRCAPARPPCPALSR